ncbi:hypothetical protein [Geomonas sp.]|uniref:beta strand repeat-containing protein n=1 Tax=Geomonas sp. TaxID=2651584 RepID=UPI002B45DF7A|nr:hypothetical protein [Geomonas sp.]HJV35285.1 hypothetical protein [Geomonas sp.]
MVARLIADRSSYHQRKSTPLVALLFFVLLCLSPLVAHGAITVTRTSGPQFYTDTSISSPGMPSCGYVSFNVTTSSAITDAWATIGAFTGGYLSVSGGGANVMHLGPMSAGQTKPVFFFLCSSYTTLNNSPPQGFDISVYSGNPSAGGTLANSSTISTVINNNVIQANPNTVNVIISGPNPAQIGGLVTMTVDGDTGTTGCVNPPSACTGAGSGPLEFSPATFTNWRADAFQMIGSNITLSGGNSGSWDNVLYLDTLPNSATSHYLATFYFRAMAPTGTTTTLSPVSYIASGTQIKHTTLSNGAYTTSGGLQPVDPPQSTIYLTKTGTPTLPAQGGRATYTVTAINPGQNAVTLDTFIDVLPTGATYVAGSSSYNGTSLPDPATSGSTLTWSSMFSIAGGNGTSKLVFQADLPATPGTYTDSATARIGTTVIDSTVQLGDNVPATASTVVLRAPTISETITPSALGVNGVAAIILTITNPNSGYAMNGISFSDTLPVSPSGLSLTAGPRGATVETTCKDSSGGTVPLSVTGSTFGIPVSANATLAAGTSCTVTAYVTSAGINTTYTNTTGAVSSTDCGTGGTASASVTFTAKPTVVKSFGAGSIARNGTTALSFTISSPVPITGAAFDDLFPAGMVTASPLTVTPASPCGGSLSSWNGSTTGTLSATGGDPGIHLGNGSIPSANGSCSFSVNVTAATPGTYDNTAGGVSATETGAAGPGSNTAELVVLTPPGVSKSFSPGTIDKSGVSTLSITLTNNNSVAVTGLSFNDLFPAGVVTANPPNLSLGCGGALKSWNGTAAGTISAAGGDAGINFTGGTIPAKDASGNPGTCTVSIQVTSSTVNPSPGYQNVLPVGSVSSVNAGSNTAQASATLLVYGTPAIAKSFDFTTSPGTGTMVLTITNNHTTGISGLSFTDLFPSGMVTANPPSVSNSCGGTISSWNGSSSGSLSGTGGDLGIALSGGSISTPGASCTIRINLTVNAVGIYTNQTSGVSLTSPFSGTGSPSGVATWIAPLIGKTLNPEIAGPGDSSTLTISISNPSLTTTLTGVAVTDSYPTTATKPDGTILSAAMTNASSTVTSSNCGAGATLQTFTGGGVQGVSLANGTLPPGATCTFSTTVQATNTTPASYYNTTGRVISSQGVGATSSDFLQIVSKPTISKSFNPSTATFSGATATSVLTIRVDNNSTSAVSSLSLTDVFPANPSQMRWVQDAGNSNSCGGTLTDASGAALVSGVSTGLKLVNGSIPAPTAGNPNPSCTIVQKVSVSATGSYTNTTSGATSSINPSPGPTGSATLQAILAAPTVTKSFASANFQTGGADRLTITVTNPNAAAITGLNFVDTYPSNMVNASVPNVVIGPASSGCSGQAVAGGGGNNQLSVTQGNIPGNNTSCTFSVDVTTTVPNNYTNTLAAGSILSNNAAAPTAAVSASVTALQPPTVMKVFGDTSKVKGYTTTLSLTLTNPSANPVTLTGLRLDDTFPSGMTLQNTTFSFTPSGCGSVTNTSGGTSSLGDGNLRLSVPTLAPGASCQVTANVTSSVPGTITNTTNAPTASGPTSLTGYSASAPILFYGVPVITVSKTASAATANPGQVVTYTIRVTNTGDGPGTSTLLTDDLSPYSSLYFSNGSPFTFTDTWRDSQGNPSTLAMGTPSYSNNKKVSWYQRAVGDTFTGYDGTITSWRIPMVNSIGAGESFTVQYRVKVN